MDEKTLREVIVMHNAHRNSFALATRYVVLVAVGLLVLAFRLKKQRRNLAIAITVVITVAFFLSLTKQVQSTKAFFKHKYSNMFTIAAGVLSALYYTSAILIGGRLLWLYSEKTHMKECHPYVVWYILLMFFLVVFI